MPEANIIERALQEAKQIHELAAKKYRKALMEKIDPTIRKRVDALLEQNDIASMDDVEGMDLGAMPDLGGMPDMGGGDMEAPAPADSGSADATVSWVKDIPMKVFDGEKGMRVTGEPGKQELGDHPEPDQELKINAEGLIDMVDAQTNEIDKLHEQFMGMIENCGAKKKDEPLEEGALDDEIPPLQEEKEENQEKLPKDADPLEGENNEDIYELTESELNDLVVTLTEKLLFDYQLLPHGHMGHANQAELNEFEDLRKALAKVDSISKKNKTLKEQVENFKYINENITDQLTQLKAEKRALMQEKAAAVLASQKSQLVINVLGNTSLIPSKKSQIAEQIHRAATYAEAKAVYETTLALLAESTRAATSSKPLSRNRGVISEVKATLTRKSNLVESFAPDYDAMESDVTDGTYTNNRWSRMISRSRDEE